MNWITLAKDTLIKIIPSGFSEYNYAVYPMPETLKEPIWFDPINAWVRPGIKVLYLDKHIVLQGKLHRCAMLDDTLIASKIDDEYA